jgi:pyridinium-3,5-bisthiocarboxylic acid mononucleotide nickel chelatase
VGRPRGATFSSTMPIAILDPFSGISGDMTLGALVDVGLDPEWLRALPARLGLDGVVVRVQDVRRGEIACKKVDFDIPPQPHGRHIREIRALVAAADVPTQVREKADAAFTAIATAEGEIHGVAAESVHLHEVGAVDAILDIVGAVWGFALLGVDRVFCGPLSLGDGFVTAAHGVLPVPAPATLRLLEGHPVRPGPEHAGELVTPTGAALVKVLSVGQPPAQYVPRRSGFGAGSKDPRGRANALRVILADGDPVSHDSAGGHVEQVVLLAADIDDMSPEYVALAAEALRAAGALDVVLLSTVMKKGRPGTRLEVLARPEGAEALEAAIFAQTATLGVRRAILERRVLGRSASTVQVFGHAVRVKVSHGPGGSRRAKPEFEDVRRVAEATGRPARDIFLIAAEAAEHM